MIPSFVTELELTRSLILTYPTITQKTRIVKLVMY